MKDGKTYKYNTKRTIDKLIKKKKKEIYIIFTMMKRLIHTKYLLNIWHL